MIKALFFDLDGTLVDTMPDIASAIETALKKNGFPCHPKEVYPSFVGSGLREAGRRALPLDKRDESSLVELMYRDILDAYRAAPVVDTRAYSGISELLTSLKSLKIDLAVVTNKDLVIARDVIDRCLPAHLFSAVAGVDSGTPPKPDPSGSLRILKQLRLRPEEVILIGDSDVDAATAETAGFGFIAVSWGYRTKEQLRSAGAKRFADSPEDILKTMEEEL
jgi:phosphoglycolate phosphatase